MTAKEDDPSNLIIGMDPSLTEFGWACYDFGHDSMTVGCVRPKSPDACRTKAERRAADAAEIYREILRWTQSNHPVAVCSERLTWPRGLVGAGQYGIAFGVACSVAAELDTPLIQMSTKDVRAHCVGRKGAAKKEIQAWAMDRWPDAGWSKLKCELDDEADAAAVAYACAHHSPELRLALR